jgi:hypothetical protein
MSNARQTEILNQFQEGLTHYAATISSDHSYVHKGLAFTAIINTGSISAAYDIAFTTPSENVGKYIHWRPIGISSSADYTGFTLYEGDTFSSGTAVTPVNRNRNVSTTSQMQTFVKGATATPAGTIIQAGGIGTSGNPTAQSGGGSGADQELLLKPDTNYVLTLTPAGATICVLELFWYEEDGYVAS